MPRPPLSSCCLILLALSLAGCGTSPPADVTPAAATSVLPSPRSAVIRGGAFTMDRETALVVLGPEDADTEMLVSWWPETARVRWGVPLEVRRMDEDAAELPGNAVVLRLDRAWPGAMPSADGRRLDEPGARDESYRLDVSPERVMIHARDAAGLFYGLRTLEQLAPAEPGDPPFSIPAVSIRDEPRFGYRGLHLDVARHFFPVSFVKRYIDLMSRFKLNAFHWHLTEDQGWRIEIERYPRLTEVGAFRRETVVDKELDPYVGDGTPYGGFYTQREIREVVEYARRRFVTVIPEIEMPGHSLAALAAYPHLACTEGPFEVGTRWGIYEDIYCPKEDTFVFLEGVLGEVMDLFPSLYIHVGGDEAPKTRWEESPVAQEVMRREGLASEEELQSWFIQRIAHFLERNGRRLIGWDEILEGGLAEGATVMSWRGTEGGIEAAREGHDVVMTPYSHLYFDYYQADPEGEPLAIGGFIPLEEVFDFEPVPDELDGREARHVLGAQANVWTEYMKTPEKVEYMAYPRVLALAERVWAPADRRDLDAFLERVEAALEHLDALGVRYRPLDPDVAGRGG